MRKICVVSGTRADYGLLFWTMKEIQNSKDFELQTIATCMHLSEKFGSTWKNFENDGFGIDERVNLGELNDSRESLLSQISHGVTKFGKAFERLKPDLVLILGDRYEMLAAAQASVFMGVPIAHIHGGEITEGAFDDIVRHSLTKMSTFHFCSTDTYRKRIIQMGEYPQNVLNVGAVGLEALRKMELLKRGELEKKIGFKLREINLLVTYHPVTAANESGMEELLTALSEFPDFGQIITMPNSDPGHDDLFQALARYAKEKANVLLTTSLGMLNYISALKICDVVVGNSSSGIIEAPFFGAPTVNIGVRQKGRLRAESVIDVEPASREIMGGIRNALKVPPAKSLLHGTGHSSSLILNFLRSRDFVVKKGFYDI